MSKSATNNKDNGGSGDAHWKRSLRSPIKGGTAGTKGMVFAADGQAHAEPLRPRRNAQPPEAYKPGSGGGQLKSQPNATNAPSKGKRKNVAKGDSPPAKKPQVQSQPRGQSTPTPGGSVPATLPPLAAAPPVALPVASTLPPNAPLLASTDQASDIRATLVTEPAHSAAAAQAPVALPVATTLPPNAPLLTSSGRASTASSGGSPGMGAGSGVLPDDATGSDAPEADERNPQFLQQLLRHVPIRACPDSKSRIITSISLQEGSLLGADRAHSGHGLRFVHALRLHRT